MLKTTRKVAFLPTLGFLAFDFNIFYCNTSCLVYLPTQHRRKPIQGTDRSFHPETGVYGWISRGQHEVILSLRLNYSFRARSGAIGALSRSERSRLQLRNRRGTQWSSGRPERPGRVVEKDNHWRVSKHSRRQNRRRL